MTDDGESVMRKVGFSSGVFVGIVSALLVVAVAANCAALRSGDHGRTGTAAVIEAPAEVGDGSATAVGVATSTSVRADIDATKTTASGDITARRVNVGDRIGGNGDSVAMWILIVALASTSVLGDVLNYFDRRRFHNRAAEAARVLERTDQ